MNIPTNMECKKCESPGNILLRKKYVYCNNCFLTNTNHKFRACIGKNKILSKNEKVLVCLSGSLGSTVLLDLIFNGLCMDSHKKLRIIPIFLHLIGVEINSLTNAEMVIKQCASYNFNVYIVHTSQYMEENLQLPVINRIPSLSGDTVHQFNSLLKGLTNTTVNDFLPKIQRNLFIKCADKLDCKFIFTGNTTSTLAINLLSNLALGRGSQVEHDVGFCDARNENIKIIKPMKEITQEELNFYSNMKKLNHVKHNQLRSNSLQSVIEAFVTELQDTFPATISTVCKTADKIGNNDETNRKGKCIICESDLEIEDTKLTALEATKFSRSVSNGKLQEATTSSSSCDLNFDNIHNDVSNSLFPYINKELCYGCSRNYSEINNIMPNHVQRLFLNQ